MSEVKTRKVHTPEFKAKVGLEALRGVKPDHGFSLGSLRLCSIMRGFRLCSLRWLALLTRRIVLTSSAVVAEDLIRFIQELGFSRRRFARIPVGMEFHRTNSICCLYQSRGRRGLQAEDCVVAFVVDERLRHDFYGDLKALFSENRFAACITPPPAPFRNGGYRAG